MQFIFHISRRLRLWCFTHAYMIIEYVIAAHILIAIFRWYDKFSEQSSILTIKTLIHGAEQRFFLFKSLFLRENASIECIFIKI